MAQCAACGEPIPEGLAACPSCGAAVNTDAEGQAFQQGSTPGGQARIEISSIIWGMVSFLIPLVGLVLYLIWYKSNPQRARFIIIGAVIGAIFGLFTNLLIPVLTGGTPLLAPATAN